MPRVEEFCAYNVTRLLLGVVIMLGLFLAVGYWVFYSPGKGNLVEHSIHQPAVVK